MQVLESSNAVEALRQACLARRQNSSSTAVARASQKPADKKVWLDDEGRFVSKPVTSTHTSRHAHHYPIQRRISAAESERPKEKVQQWLNEVNNPHEVQQPIYNRPASGQASPLGSSLGQAWDDTSSLTSRHYETPMLPNGEMPLLFQPFQTPPPGSYHIGFGSPSSPSSGSSQLMTPLGGGSGYMSPMVFDDDGSLPDSGDRREAFEYDAATFGVSKFYRGN